jgi:hypothetical protein
MLCKALSNIQNRFCAKRKQKEKYTFRAKVFSSQYDHLSSKFFIIIILHSFCVQHIFDKIQLRVEIFFRDENGL